MNYLHQDYFHALRNPSTSKQYIINCRVSTDTQYVMHKTDVSLSTMSGCVMQCAVTYEKHQYCTNL